MPDPISQPEHSYQYLAETSRGLNWLFRVGLRKRADPL